jgi:hypothetical protein
MPAEKNTLKAALVLTATLLLANCAISPNDISIAEDRLTETADLSAVADDALQSATQLGLDKLLVVFDLDNTLLAMEQGLGADQWYEWQRELGESDRCDERVVADRLAVQGALYYASGMRPTQADAAAQLRRIQAAGIPVIALTSRGPDYWLHTFRELRRNGFDFRPNAIGPDGGWNEEFLPDNGIRPARYKDGVFLTAGQHKGAMLQDLIRRTGHPQPSLVIMTDDKQANLDAVVETMHSLDIAVHAWRYNGEDQNVAAFDANQAADQWRKLEPALRALQESLGPDHFELPENVRPDGCPD